MSKVSISNDLGEEQTEPIEKPQIKKVKKKNLRQRRRSDDDEKEHSTYSPLEDIKEKQKLRNKPHGISLIGLALGKKIAPEDEITITNPLDLKSGGLVNLHSLKHGRHNLDDEYEVNIGTQFSAETNKRVEDDEMMKYIETELSKRKGLSSEQNKEGNGEETQKYLSPEDAALLSLPIHLRIPNSSNRSEEMLSNQMLNGIPEVDLGIEAKIRNIEATEDAKAKLIKEQQNKKDGPSHFVPTNMAVNFMQHNRFKIDDNNEIRRRTKDHEEQTQVGPNGVKRATDDYHYDKFRKQFRRY